MNVREDQVIYKEDLEKYLVGDRRNSLSTIWEETVQMLPPEVQTEARVKGFKLVDKLPRDRLARYMTFKLINPSEELEAAYEEIESEHDEELLIVYIDKD